MNSITNILKTCSLVAALTLGTTGYADPVDGDITYQGKLLENGQPYDGPNPILFSMEFYAQAEGGSWVGEIANLEVYVADDGTFSVTLPTSESWWDEGEQYWVEIAVNGLPMSPRQKITTAPYSGFSLNTRGITVDDSNGENIGIGTDSPANPLSVVGTVDFTGGNVGIGTDSPAVKLHVSNNDLGGGINTQDELSVEAENAWMTLYSSPGGATGSVFRLAELSGGVMTDSWNFSRKTSGSGSFLDVKYTTHDEVGRFTPSGQFMVNSTNASNGTFAVKQLSDDSSSGIAVTDAADTRALRFWVDDSGNGRISHRVNGNGDIIINDGGGFVGFGTTAPDAPLHVRNFDIGATDPAMIVQDGYVGIGTDNPWASLVVRNEGAADERAFAVSTLGQRHVDVATITTVTTHPDAAALYVQNLSGTAGYGVEIVAGPTSGTVPLHVSHTGGAGELAVYVDGDFEITGSAYKPGGGSWTSSSDARLKRNIRGLNGALEQILSLRGTVYEPQNPDDHRFLPGQQMGFIAQEVERVFPEWVEFDDDGYRMLTIRGFEALTVEAVRELRQEKDEEIAELKARVELLESMVNQLVQLNGGK